MGPGRGREAGSYNLSYYGNEYVTFKLLWVVGGPSALLCAPVPSTPSTLPSLCGIRRRRRRRRESEIDREEHSSSGCEILV